MASPRFRTAPGIAAIVALILVAAFGNPSYTHWAAHNARPTNIVNAFLDMLAWPSWSFDTNDSIQDLASRDLRAVLVIVLAGVFTMLVGRSGLTGARGMLSHTLHGWGAYMFAGGFAGLIAAFVATNASGAGALDQAMTGAGYGLVAGWIVGLATLAADGG